MTGIFSNVILFVYILICVALVLAVASQTSKNEGLTGMLGGKVEASPYMRKKTWEEQLGRITTFLAWSFLFLSTTIMLLGL